MTTERDHVRAWHRMVRMIGADPALKDQALLLARCVDEGLTGPLTILARFTDARAAGGTIRSSDGPFTFIAQTVADQAGTTTVEWLHLTFFNRVLRLWHDDQALAEKISQAAHRPGYWDEVVALDHWLSDRHAGGDIDERPALVTERDPNGVMTGDEWRALLAGELKISQIPVGYFRSEISVLPQLPNTFAAYTVDPDAYNRAAKTLMDAARAANPDFDMETRARLAVALDLVSRRRFAKVRMLDLGWPDLMDRVRTPGGVRRLRLLEARVLGDTDLPAPSDAWLTYENDERLGEFLRLQPHFRMIPDDQLSVVVGASEAQGTTSPQSGEASESEWERYSDANLRLDPPDEARSPSEDPVDDAPGVWRGVARLRLPSAEAEESWDVSIDVAGLRNAAANLGGRFLENLGNLVRPAVLVRAVSPTMDANATVEQIGEALWGQTLGRSESASANFISTLSGSNRVRLSVSSSLSELVDLPWECLRIPPLRIAAGLTLKTSIVRRVGEAINISNRSIGQRLRVLAVHAEPRDLPPLPGARQELRLLRDIFAEAEQQGWATVTTLENATERNLREALLRVRPQILHFTGHGGINEATGTAALIVNDESGDAFWLTAEQLATNLWDSGVVLAVLSGCDTGVNPTSDRVTFGVCQSIIRQGVPAVVATTRAVMDNAAFRFAQEFYQAFIDGYPLEACITEARKGVYMQGWDWPAWAVFAADSTDLDQIRRSNRSGMTL